MVVLVRITSLSRPFNFNYFHMFRGSYNYMTLTIIISIHVTYSEYGLVNCWRSSYSTLNHQEAIDM